jgi:hypothetical protein
MSCCSGTEPGWSVSLTSHLATRESPIRQWFAATFPDTRSFTTSTNRELFAEATTHFPVGLASPQTVGTAFDYRVRLFFGDLELKQTVAMTGTRVAGGLFDEQSVDTWFEETDAWLKGLGPARTRLTVAEEARVSSACYVLALWEQLFRGGLMALDGSPLNKFARGQRFTPARLRKLVPDDAVEDMTALADIFRRSSQPMLDLATTVPVTMNPTFAGSGPIGGADGDLLVGTCLVDIKCSKRPRLGRKLLYQLIGYPLLDWDNRYAIDTVGFYFARQGIWIAWPIRLLMGRLGGDIDSVDWFMADRLAETPEGQSELLDDKLPDCDELRSALREVVEKEAADYAAARCAADSVSLGTRAQTP